MVTNQTISIPADDATQKENHTLILNGIGNGHFKITGKFIDKEGTVHDLGSYQGEIREGEEVIIHGSDLKPQATPVASMVPLE
jgi:hypothetical protein